MKEVVHIDGSQGEGGGQILRTSLSIAMCLGLNIKVNNIRAKRSKPGLMRQHLACVKAAQAISNADVIGAAIGSTELSFAPRAIRANDYHFAVGSAGSTSLIFQTIMMPLLMAEQVSGICFEGGTHNPMAPSFDFIQQSFLPMIAELGSTINVKLEQHGFYPAGGGRWQAQIKPVKKWLYYEKTAQSEFNDRQALVLTSQLKSHIAARELQQVKQTLEWPDANCQHVKLNAPSPGNVVSLRLSSASGTAMFEAYGEKRLSAEKVALKAINNLQDFVSADVPVCQYLADQLLLPLSLGAGGKFITQKPTLHLQSNARLIEKLIGIPITITQLNERAWEVAVNQKHH